MIIWGSFFTVHCGIPLESLNEAILKDDTV